MLPKNFTNNKTKTIIVSCITLILGVLFCCSLSFGTGLSWLMGGSLCFAGIMYIINSILERRSLLTMAGIIGFGAVAFGVMFIAKSLAQILIDFVPYLMIAIGILLFIEAFLAKFTRYHSITIFVIVIVVSVAFLALGICLMAIPSWSRVASIIFGCILIIASLYTLLSLVINKKKN